MEPVQTIIVLGRGIDLEGNLPANARTRVERAVSLYKELQVPVIFSGRWTYRFTDPVPPITEAAAMAKYAQSLGLPSSVCLLEETSKDTIGNAIFTKKQYLVPNKWQSLCVVTSVDHAKRTEYIFRKVCGPEYSYRFEACPIGTDEDLIARSTAREERSLSVTQQLLDPVADGDDEGFDYLVKNVLFAYTKNPKGITAEELRAMLGD